MSGASDDTMTASAPRYTRRLSDKILITFHFACDKCDFEVVVRPLQVLEAVVAPRSPSVSGERRDLDNMVAATNGFGSFVSSSALSYLHDRVGMPSGTTR